MEKMVNSMGYEEKVKQPVCLVVIDGWGLSKEEDGNAIYHAKTPVMKELMKDYAFKPLEAHGLAVGLPDGLMGNSEVGHLNMGAGRVVYQDIIRIDLAMNDGSFVKNNILQEAFKNAQQKNGRLHVIGLVSDGGVHSHLRHLFGLLDAAKQHHVPKTFVHFISDGRDTRPTSGGEFLQQLLDYMTKIHYGQLATIIGRYYAMDRDKRWERVKVAYEALVKGLGEYSQDPVKTVKERYVKEETDEFLKPIIVNENGIIQDNDTLIFFNFRSDRMREIVETFGVRFNFETDVKRNNLYITTFTRYNADFGFPVIFLPQEMTNCLAEWLSSQKIPQYHIAETEKYAHVTFFFNGGTEQKFELEDRKMVASPKVATYDLKPDMSVYEVGQEVCLGIASNKYPFIMCNLAPPDMVGHTGSYEQTIHAVEATDSTIGRILETCRKHGYTLFVTADHGNAEKMFNEKGGPHTAHTCSPVPFIMASMELCFNPSLTKAALCDVAPTILEVMGLPIPKEMTGKSLLSSRV